MVSDYPSCSHPLTFDYFMSAGAMEAGPEDDLSDQCSACLRPLCPPIMQAPVIEIAKPPPSAKGEIVSGWGSGWQLVAWGSW